MKNIDATLPNLGNYSIPFYKESSKILEFWEEKELNRLLRIPHLGTAASVFTGINHSRLEYMLLQCTITNLLPKFNLNTEKFALGSQVNLPNSRIKFSSVEELIKCWSILSNIGHTQYTFGVERSFLNCLREDKDASKFVIKQIKNRLLKKWSAKVINHYDDQNFHWVILILRITEKAKNNNSMKSLLYTCILSLIIPFDQLKFASNSDKYKLYRTREIFKKIRLLSLVTLDSYYSHQPIRYQLSTAVIDLENLFYEDNNEFEKLMIRTASWLADEVYMHPKASATLREYEMKSKIKIDSWKSKITSYEKSFYDYMRNFIHNGFGQPSKSKFEIFLRVKISKKQRQYFKNRDEYEIRKLLESKIFDINKTPISVLKNPFTNVLYIDLFYQRNTSEPSDIGRLCSGFYSIYSKSLNKYVNSRIDSLLDSVGLVELSEAQRNKLCKNIFTKEIFRFYEIFSEIIQGVVRYICPNNVVGCIIEYIPENERSRSFLVKIKTGVHEFNNIDEKLDLHINHNPNNLCSDRIQELKAIKYHVKNSKYPCVIVCIEKFILRDNNGRHVDDWDGHILEVSEDNTYLTIIEAKNKRTFRQNEKEAFEQLGDTINIIRSSNNFMYRRSKIPHLGARLRVNFNS